MLSVLFSSAVKLLLLLFLRSRDIQDILGIPDIQGTQDIQDNLDTLQVATLQLDNLTEETLHQDIHLRDIQGN